MSSTSDPANVDQTNDQPIEQAIDLPKASQKTPVPFGIVPRSIDEAWRLGVVMSRSDLVPKQFRDKPYDCVVAYQLGAELGLAPMQSLQSIAVINGRPTIYGDGFLAIIMQSAAYQDHDEYFESAQGLRVVGLRSSDLTSDATAAVCTFWRKGKQLPVTRRFTIGQAKKAGLFGKAGPWQEYPDRMLLMKARSFAGRDCFADVLRGIEVREALTLPTVDSGLLPPVRRLSDLAQLPTAADDSPDTAVNQGPTRGGVDDSDQ